jgi:uncharacterized protein
MGPILSTLRVFLNLRGSHA